MDIQDVSEAPAHASRLDGIDDLHIFRIADDMGSHDNQEFGPSFRLRIEAEQRADQRHTGDKGNAS